MGQSAPHTHWDGSFKIPWNEQAFSRRLLDEHLDQTHDAASRRLPVIGRQIQWIHHRVLHAKPGRVLDLCCGPGLAPAGSHVWATTAPASTSPPHR